MGKYLIYQLLPRLWGNIEGKNKQNGTLAENGCGTFGNIDGQTLDYLKGMGFTHIWLTGVVRHATAEDTCGCTPSSSDWVKGRAGSPYAITDYYDVNPYLADNPENRMDEFRSLVERVHSHGFKLLIDFVPNHVARDYTEFTKRHPAPTGMESLGENDDTSVHWKAENDFFYYPGQYLRLPVENQTYAEYPAKASGNTYTATPGVNDWYDTVKLNYCDFHTKTWDKMLDIIEFWLGMGVDGFRCDMVELVPAEFFKWMIAKVKTERPDACFIAEVYQKTSYAKYIREVGFDLLYDKSGIYDALKAITDKNVANDGVPVEDWQSARRLTWNWQFLGDLQPYMLNFLENHDEVRFASDWFGKDAGKSFASLCAALLFNKTSFMLYAGEEIGEKGMDSEGFSGINGRTSIFDWWAPDSITRLYSHIHGDGSALTEDETSLLEKYRKLLTLSAKEPAFSEGATYDLCYCNSSSEGFNPDVHFAFLRNCGSTAYLIACNFANTAADASIFIPEHAFNWLKLQETDEVNHSKPFRVHIEPMDGVILKLFR